MEEGNGKFKKETEKNKRIQFIILIKVYLYYQVRFTKFLCAYATHVFLHCCLIDGANGSTVQESYDRPQFARSKHADRPPTKFRAYEEIVNILRKKFIIHNSSCFDENIKNFNKKFDRNLHKQVLHVLMQSRCIFGSLQPEKTTNATHFGELSEQQPSASG